MFYSTVNLLQMSDISYTLSDASRCNTSNNRFSRVSVRECSCCSFDPSNTGALLGLLNVSAELWPDQLMPRATLERRCGTDPRALHDEAMKQWNQKRIAKDKQPTLLC
jgi:hypothetical protein